MYYIAQHLNVQEVTFSFLTLRVHFMVSHQLKLLSNIYSTAQKIISLLSRPVMWMLMRLIMHISAIPATLTEQDAVSQNLNRTQGQKQIKHLLTGKN